MTAKRIVVLGGGFGGVYAARFLERLLRPAEAEICLVNREDYFVFQPLLPEIISGSIGVMDTIAPIRRLCPRTRLYMREVESVDLDARTVSLAPAFRPRTLELPYDYLIIAAGTTNDFSAAPGLSDHALPFRTLGDALRLRNQVLHAMEEADNETDAAFRQRLLTFVVAGGGFSGVEVVAELNDFVRRAARHFHTIKKEELRCVLVQSGARILPEITPPLAAYAHQLLEKRGVEVRLHDRLVAATAESAVLKSGEIIATRTLVATVPSGPVPLVRALDSPKEHGRLIANANLELVGHEQRVWVIGDCAAIKMPDGSRAPATAQHATREARTVAENVAAVIHGKPQKTFAFSELGKLGALGHHSAVAQIGGLRISGMPAWFLWRTIYLMKMPGFDRKLRVALDWTASLLIPAEMAQLRVQVSSSIASEHFEIGESVFEQGDVGDRMYVLRSGELEVVRDGTRVANLSAGAYFGEMALLTNSPRTATVRATQPCDVLAIGKGDFHKLLATFPEFGSAITSLAASRLPGTAAADNNAAADNDAANKSAGSGQ